MRLVTFQDIFVIKKIIYEQQENNSPVFFNREINFQEREMYVFNKFVDKMKQKLQLPMDRPMLPIWCWVVRKNQELDNDFINELYDRSIPHCKQLTLYELEVPDDGVFISNFDVWKEISFNMKFSIPVDNNMFNRLFEKQKGATLQACIPFIHKQFITGIKYFNRAIDGNYKETEEEISKLIEQGEIKLDKNGNIWSITE